MVYVNVLIVHPKSQIDFSFISVPVPADAFYLLHWQIHRFQRWKSDVCFRQNQGIHKQGCCAYSADAETRQKPIDAVIDVEKDGHEKKSKDAEKQPWNVNRPQGRKERNQAKCSSHGRIVRADYDPFFLHVVRRLCAVAVRAFSHYARRRDLR